MIVCGRRSRPPGRNRRAGECRAVEPERHERPGVGGRDLVDRVRPGRRPRPSETSRPRRATPRLAGSNRYAYPLQIDSMVLHAHAAIRNPMPTLRMLSDMLDSAAQMSQPSRLQAIPATASSTTVVTMMCFKRMRWAKERCSTSPTPAARRAPARPCRAYTADAAARRHHPVRVTGATTPGRVPWVVPAPGCCARSPHPSRVRHGLDPRIYASAPCHETWRGQGWAGRADARRAQQGERARGSRSMQQNGRIRTWRCLRRRPVRRVDDGSSGSSR